MQYYRCKCGKGEYWGSGMSPQPCQGCKECGTTYAGSPSGHKPIEPHTPGPLKYDENTGKPSHHYCTRCHTKLPCAST